MTGKLGISLEYFNTLNKVSNVSDVICKKIVILHNILVYVVLFI